MRERSYALPSRETGGMLQYHGAFLEAPSVAKWMARDINGWPAAGWVWCYSESEPGPCKVYRHGRA